MQNPLLLDLYKYMLMSRESDIIEAELVNSGEANFLASSKGHEGSVILAPFLHNSDYLHCHYRDKALMLARGITSEMFFYSALSKSESHSNGRQMVSHMSAREYNVMSIVGPVGNNALQAVGVAFSIKQHKDKPIVICSMGDGTTQQGEVFEAIAEAKRSQLPVLFFIHNNNLAISTSTQNKTFFSLPKNQYPESFYGIPITHIDGIRPFAHYTQVESIINNIRESKNPHIIILNVDRLDNHSNADNQKLYRTDLEINKSKENDPILHCYNFLMAHNFDAKTLMQIKSDTILQIRQSLEIAKLGKEPSPCFSAELPLTDKLTTKTPEYRGNFNASERLTMLEAMRQVLYNQLENNKNVYLFGQDIEDDKGDVFGVTRGLSTKFPEQVKNSALSEATIVGMSIGMALTGKLPVAFIQFADFMPLAYNQIFSELATMYWRTNSTWQCPVIVFAACGGYRPGLGPFHSQTNEATYAHIPGIDVYMPSNAADAAGMLNAAFKSGRPSVYLYPKRLLNNSSIQDTTSVDIASHLIPIGKARIAKSGQDITLIGLGNTVSLCHQVSDTLERYGIDAEIIDLRSIKPFDIDTILTSVQKTKHLIITHEDNQTCGIGGEIIATIMERITVPIKVRRVTRADTFTPCNFSNQLQVLPSYASILTVAAELLNFSLTWKSEENEDNSLYTIEVIGASPSDENVLIAKIHVQVGDSVKSGDTLVEIEASKSAGEIVSPCDGIVEKIYVTEAQTATVGNPLLILRLASGVVRPLKAKNKEPILIRKKNINTPTTALENGSTFKVGLRIPHFKTGTRKVSNEEILKNFPNYSNDDIMKLTGIESRYWLANDETILDVAATVAIEAMMASNLKLSDIDMIICTTSTPEKYQSPSLACLVLEKLYHTYGEHIIAAYDISAACSGYIYALQSAHDYLQTRPHERVLLITAEALSKRVNLKDFDTAFLFGDAATATILVGNKHICPNDLVFEQLCLQAIAENGSILNVPIAHNQGITLQGKKLFTFAVKTMAAILHKCCQKNGMAMSELDLIIPHQANQRIINAIESRLNLQPGAIFSNIAHYGNTSSCTIPIALAETLPHLSKAECQLVALCAFGAGFTAGAAILRTYK